MKVKGFVKETLKIVAAALVLAFILTRFIMVPCLVGGSSMNPILTDGDYGYSFIITRLVEIKRFDIAVIDVENQDNEKYLVKRVIGLPNETITYSENKLYINGEYVEEDFLDDDVITMDFSYTLGEDEYFCMGDNRSVSRDSRFYGPFMKDDILSTHIFVIYPFRDFGLKH